MNRRTAIKAFSLGLGYTITLGGLTTFFSACQAEKYPKLPSSLAFLSKDQAAFLEEVMNQILPTTETSPGFKDIGGIAYVDLILERLYAKKKQNEFSTGFQTLLNQIGVSSTKDGWFPKLGSEVIPAMLKSYMCPNHRNEKQDRKTQPIISVIRSLAFASYFGHPLIAREHLNYDPIPGRYDGCIPLSEIGNSWSI